MASTTGHEEARLQVAGETGYEARELHGVIVYSDGRTEHASIFYPDPDKKAKTAEEREADKAAAEEQAAADKKAKADEKAKADAKAADKLTAPAAKSDNAKDGK